MVYVAQPATASDLTSFSWLKASGAFPTGRVALGLAEGPIVVTPIFKHHDMHTDDFGPDIPADVMWMLAEAHIDMTLIHFDNNVLETCIALAMAGSGTEGTLIGAGRLMGSAIPLGIVSNNYIELSISSQVLARPWRFPASYLMDQMDVPLGTQRTAIKLKWRAIPYVSASRSLMNGAKTFGDNDFLKSAGAG